MTNRDLGVMVGLMRTKLFAPAPRTIVDMDKVVATSAMGVAMGVDHGKDGNMEWRRR